MDIAPFSALCANPHIYVPPIATIMPENGLNTRDAYRDGVFQVVRGFRTQGLQVCVFRRRGALTALWLPSATS